jgi:hypothetical protein
MTQPYLCRPGRADRHLRGSSLLTVLGLTSLLSASLASAAPLPYDQAVANTDTAARAVLARGGRETCLRGKLTRALLGLSSSCEASGTRNALCSLADKAVVVTPMSLSFMDETSHQLLELIHPSSASLPRIPPAAAPEAAASPEP